MSPQVRAMSYLLFGHRFSDGAAHAQGREAEGEEQCSVGFGDGGHHQPVDRLGLSRASRRPAAV